MRPEPVLPSVLADGPLAPLEASLVDEAIAWVIRLRYGSVQDASLQVAWQQWLGRSAAHAEAWRRVAAMEEDVRQWRQPEVAATWSALGRQRRGRRRVLLGLGVLAVAGGAGTVPLAPHVPWQRWVADHHTRPGEQQRLALAGGTEVHLNTDTALDVHAHEPTPVLHLRRGEILMQAGTGSPGWLVQTAQGWLESRGTRYQVRLREQATEVTVLEGDVQAQPRHRADAMRRLQPADPWLLYDDHIAPGPVGLRAGAWMQQVLDARDLPLTHVLEEIGRYRPGYLTVAPSLAGRRVSGLYHLSDVERLLRFLAHSEGLELHQRSRYWLHVTPATAV